MLKSGSILVIFLCALLSHITSLNAQSSAKKNNYPKGKSPEDFPELVFTNIPGAPKLSNPKLIKGRIAPVIGAGMGWASPALFDWDGDGKKDLLIGEFASGLENKMSTGNFIRVYKNEGTEAQPEFSGIFNYAHGIPEQGDGSPISVYTWCCMPFTPRFADLNGDGYPDLLTGQYNPGFVNWFRGSEEGFLSSQRLEETGNVPKFSPNNRLLPITDTLSQNYWSYSAAAFGDFDEDGKIDMVIGGNGGLRLSYNIGTKTTPKYGMRTLLLDINEKPLTVTKRVKHNAPSANPSGAVTVPYVVDWDQDGVLDLLVTHFYISPGDVVISFFRGLKTIKGLRFEPGVPLFTAKNGGKAFPGSVPNVCVGDWNNDGINDLIIGTCVATINGAFNHKLSWEWESENNLFKINPAYLSDGVKEMANQDLEHAAATQKKNGWTEEEAKKNFSSRREVFKRWFGREDVDMNLAHQGFVYVMLGYK